MTRAITHELLKRHCCQSAESMSEAQFEDTLDALGWLSPFLLSDAALQRARDVRPGYDDFYSHWLPEGHGACHIVFVGLRSEELPLLGSAAVLPVRWIRDSGHHPHLPLVARPDRPNVRQVADDVLRVLKISGWGLSLNVPPGHESIDLSLLELSARSGWPALAGGLLLAIEGLSPDRRIWATGSWDDQLGLVPVIGLEAKMTLARAYGATAFFMPVGDDSRKLEAVHRPFARLFPAERDFDKALAPYLAELGLPPGSDEPFERLRKFYQLLLSPERRTNFYCETLLRPIADGLSNQLAAEHKDWKPTHFITILSGGLEVAFLVPRALGVSKCLMLHTNDSFGKKVKAQVENLKSALGKVVPEVFEFDNGKPLEPQFRQALAEFLKDAKRPEDVAFDLTPGQRLMSWTLESLAPEGSSLVYVRHKSDGNNRAIPDVERLVRRIAGEPITTRLVLPVG